MQLNETDPLRQRDEPLPETNVRRQELTWRAPNDEGRPMGGLLAFGAGNQVRTGDLNLGKVALYQLSYSRNVAVSCAIGGVSERSR